MRAWEHSSAPRWLGALWLLVSLGGCGERRVVGEQCESPLLQGIAYYGTSCAPCTGERPRLDERGCPMFVTFEDCGGDICLGNVLVQVPIWPDAGLGDAGDDDAGGDPALEGGGD